MKTTEKLDPEFKAKWVAALRSGEYTQARGQMIKSCATGYTYCCLGVAYHILNGDTFYNGGDPYDKLPSAINRGFNNPIASKLIDMNDGTASFEDIANYIEANL
jgi:hypothetical protein